MSAASLRRAAAATLLMLALLVALLVAWLLWHKVSGDSSFAGPDSTVLITPQLVERGAYLARAGNCAACHSPRGGGRYAGGPGIATPFGTVFAGNLTPEPTTGIGHWSASDFWRAIHNGRSKSGRLLYPAFPYPNYTQVRREDADAIYAFLRSLPPVVQPNRPHELRFPYNSQAALAIWRALFFRAAVFEPQADRSAEWNRGAYLVRGLGHCIACHSTRNALGATNSDRELGGGLIPVQNWYAPSLVSSVEAGVADWATDDVVDLLRTGTSRQGSVLGPMAAVVFNSTQHLHDADLRAIAQFLQSLPRDHDRDPAPPSSLPAAKPQAALLVAQMAAGAEIYKQHCADCHGVQGQGAGGAYPPLGGNRKVNMASATNVVRVIVEGGFAPATAGHPRPFGMPPFGHQLQPAEIAAVASYVRNAWGNRATAVSELDVMRSR